MEPRCPNCTSTNLEDLTATEEALRCDRCGARVPNSQALVRIAEAEELATERARCTCDERRGCPQCFGRAEELVGKMVRDAFGRDWRVIRVGEKERFPTIHGEAHWDLPDQVEVIGP